MAHSIRIKLTDSYRIKIEKSFEFKNSIFKEVYTAAKANLLEILNDAENSSAKTEIVNNSFNNIICFAGERGQGKSSSMISFLTALIEKNTSNDEKFFNEEKIKRVNFSTIELIDPSLFKGEETLLEIILAKMFSKFKCNLENRSNINIQDDHRRQLVNLFQEVFNNLRYINNRESIYTEDSLDALIKLSTSSNLKESFEKLVDKYLEVMSIGDNKYLIIAIDDFDLNTDGVHDMLEDIRRFLITKNIILFIACKLEQLKEAVEANIYSEYLAQVKGNSQILFNVVDEKEIKRKAVKYVDKLIPDSRRINLPDVSRLDLKKILEKKNSGFQNANTLVLETLYDRLSLFLKKEDYQESIFLKANLRSLISLLVRLNKIEYFYKNNSLKHYEAVIEFKNYIRDFLLDFLDLDQIDLILQSDINLLNFRVIQTLRLYFYSEIPNEITNIKNYNLIQNSDVYGVFFNIETQILDDDVNYDWFQSFKLLYIVRQLLYRIELSQVSDSFELDIFNQSDLINTKFIRDVLPKDEKRRSRDNFRFTEKVDNLEIFEIISNLNDIDKSILAAFIVNLGQFRESFRALNHNIFDVSLENVSTLQFSLFSFFSAPYSLLHKLTNNYSIKDNSDLKKNHKIWIESKFYYLFNNVDFVMNFYDEFIKSYKGLSKDKQFKDLSYYDILKVLLNEGLKKAFKNLNDKYSYLDLSIEDYYEAFPYAKIFVEEDNADLKRIINHIYEEQSGDKIVRSMSLTPGGINEIESVNNIDALKSLIQFLKNRKHVNFERKTLEKYVRDVDSDLRNIIMETKHFNSLFKSGGNKQAEFNRDRLIIELEKLLAKNG